MLVHTEKWTIQVQDPKLPPKPLSELIRPVGVGLSFALLGAPGSPVIISHIEQGSAAEAWYLIERAREKEREREGGRGRGREERGETWYFPLQGAACRAVLRLGVTGLSPNP
jgi:hypothetical protein